MELTCREVDILGVDILRVDILGVDILRVDILGRTCLTHKWHVTVRTVSLSPAKVVSEVLVGGIEDNPAIKGWGVEQR